MGKGRQGQAQRFVEEQLLGGVGNVIFTADHMGDFHGGVIHHHNKVVEGVADLIRRSTTGDHHVSAKVRPPPAHGPTHQIIPANFGSVINAEADHRFTAFGLKRLLLLGRQSSVAVVVARRLIGRFLRIAHGREFRFAGVAAVGQSPIEQGLYGITVLPHPFALDDGFLVPIDPEPLQAFENVLGVLGLGPLLVGVFNAQHERSLLVLGVEPIENSGSRRSNMERARRAGGQSNAHHRGSWW